MNITEITDPDVATFVTKTAVSKGTNSGYVMASILTTINFILANFRSKYQIRDGFVINLNTLWIFLGQPSTG